MPASLTGPEGRRPRSFRCRSPTAPGLAAWDGLDAERLFGVYIAGASEVAIRARYCVGRVESLLDEECGGLVSPPDLSRRGGNIAVWRHPFESQCRCFVVA